VLVAEVNGIKYEQMLVLTVGPVELWALSTTPEDVALRGRMYESLGIGEALRRLAAGFPAGTAAVEVRRRKEARMKRDPHADGAEVEAGVVDGLADELWRGVGLGAPRGDV
jgi:intracellular multiplication protein IcmB